MLKIFMLVFVIISMGICESYNAQVDREKLQGPYLGQKPPGMTPEIFAPGFISKSDSQEFAGTFSPDGKEFFFTRRPAFENAQGQRIWYTKEENGVWTEPALAPFSYDCFELEPYISPDGQRLYYGTSRPLPGQINLNNMPATWVVSKTETGWGTPEFFAPLMMFTGETLNRELYFTDLSIGGFIAVKKWNGTEYGSSEKMYENINYIESPAHPCISPDGSYLLYDGENRDIRELYISFKKADDTWTKGSKLGKDVNSGYGEMCANISPDGKYLFFESRRAGSMDIFWVSIKIIDEL
ncbi:MAG: hypothetical protein A2V66_15290 [Ignavibacteria bacterium RBG_13_36_8]|nr:MAG: hypothetical protein A2V66_15290 [Ignavibacteria bacterium RBG_13_36_8]